MWDDAFMSDLPEEFRKETIKQLHEGNSDMQRRLAKKELKKFQRSAKRLPKM
jgi:hypothetical protein